MGADPIWIATPKTGMARVTAASGLRDGTDANHATVLTAGGSGSLITAIFLQSSGAEGDTVAAGVVRLKITGGGVTRLFKEAVITNTDPSTTAAGWAETLTPGNGLPPGGLRLQAGYALEASISVAQAITVVADAGDF